MAPRIGHALARDAVAERRERVMELHRSGRYAWQIAYDTNMSIRTVQRYIAAERAGRPPGKQTTRTVRERLPVVARMLADGQRPSQIGRALGLSAGAVRHYMRRWPEALR